MIHNSRDTHLSAKSWEEDDELDRVNIIGDHNKLGLLGLDESDDVVETVLSEDGLLAILGGSLVTLLLSLLSLGSETSFLLLLRLGFVLVEELEELGSGVFVECAEELSDSRGNLGTKLAHITAKIISTCLQSLVEDDLLSLESNILGPFDESGQISLGRNVTT